MTMQIKCNKIHGFKPDQVIEVEDANGIPKDAFWRKRLNDAKLDGCCEVVAQKAPNKKPTLSKEVEENDSNK